MSETEKLSMRLSTISCAVDGLAGILTGTITGVDAQADRVAFACADHLERLSSEIDEIYVGLVELEKAQAKMPALAEVKA